MPSREGLRLAGPPDDGLSEKREVTVVVRLLIERDGAIVHGHIVDPGERPAGPFLSHGFDEALRAWVCTRLSASAEPPEGKDRDTR